MLRQERRAGFEDVSRGGRGEDAAGQYRYGQKRMGATPLVTSCRKSLWISRGRSIRSRSPVASTSSSDSLPHAARLGQREPHARTLRSRFRQV